MTKGIFKCRIVMPFFLKPADFCIDIFQAAQWLTQLNSWKYHRMISIFVDI